MIVILCDMSYLLNCFLIFDHKCPLVTYLNEIYFSFSFYYCCFNLVCPSMHPYTNNITFPPNIFAIIIIIIIINSSS